MTSPNLARRLAEVAHRASCTRGVDSPACERDRERIARALAEDVALYALLASHAAMEKRIGELEGALGPFAEYIEAVDPDRMWTDDSEIGGEIVGAFRRCITHRMLREASRLLTAKGKENDQG